MAIEFRCEMNNRRQTALPIVIIIAPFLLVALSTRLNPAF